MKFGDIFHQPPTKGEVGIEIEVEGINLPKSPKGWVPHRDGSLRGEESMEYVLSRPVAREQVGDYLDRMHKAYKQAGTRVDESNRTSVHVHINMQNYHITQVFNVITAFVMLEPMLVHFCGEEREGNLFCLRTQDAEWFFTCIEQLVTGRVNWRRGWRSNDMRYAAINLASLTKYGSLEFRSMRGTRDMTLIEQWVGILLRIKDEALKYDTPVDIIESLSGIGAEQFVRDFMGKDRDIVLTYPGWEEVVWEQARRLQMMAYTGNWKKWSFIDEPEEDC